MKRKKYINLMTIAIAFTLSLQMPNMSFAAIKNNANSGTLDGNTEIEPTSDDANNTITTGIDDKMGPTYNKWNRITNKEADKSTADDDIITKNEIMGTGTSDKMLAGYQAFANGILYTGTMKEYSGTTRPVIVSSDTVKINRANIEINIPNKGRYDINSMLSIKASELIKQIGTNNELSHTTAISVNNNNILQTTNNATVTGNFTNGFTILPAENKLLKSVVVSGDSNLVSANILSGKSIFGVSGKSSVVDTEDATAASDGTEFLNGKTAYVNGNKVTGTMVNKSNSTVSASTVAESGSNAIIAIPIAGYYDTDSKLSVPVETIKKQVSALNSSITNGTVLHKISWGATSNFSCGAGTLSQGPNTMSFSATKDSIVAYSCNITCNYGGYFNNNNSSLAQIINCEYSVSGSSVQVVQIIRITAGGTVYFNAGGYDFGNFDCRLGVAWR